MPRRLAAAPIAPPAPEFGADAGNGASATGAAAGFGVDARGVGLFARGAAVVALYTADAAAEISGEGDAATVPPHTLAWRRLPAGATLQVRAADALWMEIPA